MSGLLNIATASAHAAGKVIMQNFDRLDRVKVEKKADGSYVSNVDLIAEQTIIECIKKYYPGHDILSEESGRVCSKDHVKHDPDFLWIIDPLDGTKNFIHGVPQFATSIALQQQGKTILSVIYDSLKDETFVAEAGNGVVLNNKRIRVIKNSYKNNVENALIASGLPRNKSADFKRQQEIIANLNCYVAGIRKMGSTALNLAYIAANRFDGFIDLNLPIWDKSAGKLIVEEAGGIYFEAESITVAASSASLSKLLLQKI